MYYNSIIKTDTVNGPGIRVTLFVSGCTLNCSGCFNTAAQNFKYGSLFTKLVEDSIIHELSNNYVAGLSILGGDPMHPKNVQDIDRLVNRVKSTFDNKDVYVWTGYTLAELLSRETTHVASILANIDVLIDGRYDHQLSDRTLQWRGSSNQRILQRGEDF